MHMTKKDIERMEMQRGWIMQGTMDVYSFDVLDTIHNILKINDKLDDREKWPDDIKFDKDGYVPDVKPHEAILTLLKAYHYLNESDLVKDFAILFDKLGKMYDVAPEDFLQAIREKLN